MVIQGGSSGSPCSETYHGASAESEPETKNTANYFRYICKYKTNSFCVLLLHDTCGALVHFGCYHHSIEGIRPHPVIKL